MNTQEDKAANLETAESLINEAVAAERPDLIVLPEYYASLNGSPTEQQATGEAFPEGDSYRLMSGLAAKHQVTIHAGSVVEKSGNRFYNTTDVIVLPAAFTLQTGKDHWEVLSRARAVETQTYFLATAQIGTHADGKKACWGHTMAIDPWGAVVAQASDTVGFIAARLDKGYVGKVRENIPMAEHHVIG